MVGNGRNNVLFLMYVRFLRSSSRVKFFGLRNCLFVRIFFHNFEAHLLEK